ncbi:MAG: hypothetical protein M3Y19_00550 [Actinomycetota bacterium]|nr:hypothetical protein [Actinomycetota bacterium]
MLSYIDGFSDNTRDVFTRFGFEEQIQRLDEANALYLVLQSFTAIGGCVDRPQQDPDRLPRAKKYYEGARLTEASDLNLVFDQWDKLEAVGVFSDVDVQATAQAYFGSGRVEPLQGKLSSALLPVKDRFNTAYVRAVGEADSGEVDRLDTFRRDLRTLVNTYDFLSAIVDYDDIELEKRAMFARMLAEVLKDSQRHDPSIDLSDVTLTHHALHKQTDPELDLTKGDAAGLASVLKAGSRGTYEAVLVPWDEVMNQINTLFDGDGLSDGDQVSAVESVMRKMLESHDLRAQARANN